MTSSVIGALRVNLSADTAEFRRNLTEAERIAERFGRSIGSSIRNQIMGFGAAVAAAAGPAALGLLVKSSVETISAQVDLAKRVGASVGAIQSLQHAAQLSGASQEALAKTLGTLNQRLGEAAREGAGPAYEALQRLGLSARELSRMDADERIKALSDRMGELGLSTQQQADTLRSLGVRQQEIINLFQEGSGAIDAARQELKDWGVLLSDVDAAKVEAAGDAWDKIGTIISGVGNQLAVALSPIIQEIAEYLGEAAKEGGGFGSVIDQAVSTGVQLFGALQREIYDVRISFDSAIGAFLDGFNQLAEFPPGLLATVFGGTSKDYGFEPIKHSYGKLIETLEKPPSSEEWDAWLNEIRAKAQAAAEAAVAAGQPAGMGESDGGGEGGLSEAQQKQQARFQEQMAQKLATLQESLMTEREAELANYEQRLMDLEDFHARGMLSDQEYSDLLARNKAELSDKLMRLDDQVAKNNERAAQRQRRAYFQIADDIGSVLNSVFGESKAVAIAQALINTAQAVTRNLAEYPGPLGFAMAAAAAAAGMAEIATMRSTSKSGGGGSGGSGRSGSGGGAAAPSAPQQSAPGQSGSSQTLFISGISPGQIFTGEALRGLMEQLVEAQRDGAKIVLSQT
jgi:hypothetical protein